MKAPSIHEGEKMGKQLPVDQGSTNKGGPNQCVLTFVSWH